jgi:CheY-like chemotaxis protein
MPDMDGLAVVNVLRSYLRWSMIPVAILTAYPEDPRLWHVGEKGVERVFPKSKIDLADVLAWVDRRTLRTPPDMPPTAQAGA